MMPRRTGSSFRSPATPVAATDRLLRSRSFVAPVTKSMSATSRRTREEAGRCMRAGPLFGREREGDGPAVPGGAIDRREQLDRAPAVGGGHGGRAAREHRLEKVSNLQAVEVLHGIGAAEESGVLLLPLREQA